MHDSVQKQPFRFRWLPVLGVFTGLAFLGALLIQRIGQASLPATATLIPTVGGLVDGEALGLSFKQPGSWKPPAMRDANSFVISPTGSSDTSTTAGPFVYVVVDALDVFGAKYNLRTDLEDPVAQLDALINAANPTAARFEAAEPFRGSNYAAAFTRGFQRGNGQLVVLIRTDNGRWIYVGAQAPDAQFAFLEQTVFYPFVASLSLTSR